MNFTALLLLAVSSTIFAISTRENSIIGVQAQSAGQDVPAATSANEKAKAVDAGASHTTTDKNKRVLKIGVTQVTSSADQTLSVEGLQQELLNDINFLGGKA